MNGKRAREQRRQQTMNGEAHRPEPPSDDDVIAVTYPTVRGGKITPTTDEVSRSVVMSRLAGTSVPRLMRADPNIRVVGLLDEESIKAWLSPEELRVSLAAIESGAPIDSEESENDYVDATDDRALALFRDATGRLHCSICGVLIERSEEDDSFTACGPTCTSPFILCPSDKCMAAANLRHNHQFN